MSLLPDSESKLESEQPAAAAVSIIATDKDDDEDKDTDVVAHELPSKDTIHMVSSKLSSENMRLTSSQPVVVIKNSMSDIGEAVMNGVQVNGSGRHRACKALRRRSRPSFEHWMEVEEEDGDNEKGNKHKHEYEMMPTSEPPVAIDDTTTATAVTTSTTTTTADSEMTTPPTTTTTTIITTSSATPARTMKQLLEECEEEDFTSYAMTMHNIVKGAHNNTFSPQALKRMMSSQKSTTGLGFDASAGAV
ncbi:hypothetical protein BGZ65_009685, partial [Modicella reniformis]